MNFSARKYIVNIAIAIAAIAVGVLALLGRIAEFWSISALLAAGITVVRAWFLTIPFGKEKEAQAAERVKARLEKERTKKEGS